MKNLYVVKYTDELGVNWYWGLVKYHDDINNAQLFQTEEVAQRVADDLHSTKPVVQKVEIIEVW